MCFHLHGEGHLGGCVDRRGQRGVGAHTETGGLPEGAAGIAAQRANKQPIASAEAFTVFPCTAASLSCSLPHRDRRESPVPAADSLLYPIRILYLMWGRDRSM